MPASAKFWAIAILAWAGLAEQRAPALVDVTAESGLGDFINVQGSPAKNHIIETMGGGAAFLDYDRDGNLDILLVRGSTVERYREGGDPVCGLYRGDGRGHFQDVTSQSGMKVRGWGMGVVVGDYDNDGWDDIYVTGYGPNYLFRNRGDRTFAEVGVQAGVQDPRWSVGAAFADIDRDGDLDLYVCNYLEYDLERLPKRNAFCTYRGFDVFCGPRGLPGSRDALFLNDGKGKFRDVTIERGIDPERLYGMGVVFGDYDNDGWPDIFVANDLTPNLLYHNRGKGEFEELAVPAGVAFDENGIEEGYMGVDFGDYNNDGWLDLHYTNSSYQTDQMAVNNTSGGFILKSHPLGLGEMTWLYVGWGTFFADLDNDRWEDIFTVNGHLYPQADHFDMGLKYKQRKLLFMNQAGKKFREAGAEWGPAMIQPENSRGAAFGDYDNDGDLDVLVNNLDAPPTLLRNDGGNRNRWLIVHCLGKQSNRSAVGTRLVLRSAKLEQIREIKSGGSYASHNDMRAHFGLGSIEQIDELEIRWPSGKVEKRQNVKPNQILVIEEGKQGS
jgi:enediyne biosynthesis protein E4